MVSRRSRGQLTRRQALWLAAAGCALPAWDAVGSTTEITPREIDIGEGLRLHYLERGSGQPVVFVHGSLSDYTYWSGEVDFFSSRFRAIAYSRRYNFPNRNPPRAGYSAVQDASDLRGLIQGLRLGRVHLIGHSYGALTSLFVAARYPELVSSLVLAEPPAVTLLAHLEGPREADGIATLHDIETNMVAPLRRAFRSGDQEGGIRLFLSYVLKDPGAWDRLPAQSKAETLRNAGEWDVILRRGTLFPEIAPEAIRHIRTPTLLLSGQKSYSFLGLIDGELARLLPRNHRVILEGAGHQMWYERTATCRSAALDLFAGLATNP